MGTYLLKERREKKPEHMVPRTGWDAEGDDIRNTGCCQVVEKLSSPSMWVFPFLPPPLHFIMRPIENH